MCAAMRERLAPSRYRHVLAVARTAERLARRYGLPTWKARIAGVLHDAARQWPPDELLAYARRHGLPVSESERHAPTLLHARVGADIARREFDVSDPEVAAAIETHTVARPGMTDLQKILYLADTFEPCRQFPERAQLEAAALRSLDEGMLACIEASIEYLKERSVPVAPETMEAYRELVERYGKTS